MSHLLKFRLITICNTETLRYEAENGGSIYITKSAMGDGVMPEELEISYDSATAPPPSREEQRRLKAEQREAKRKEREAARDAKRKEREEARRVAREQAEAKAKAEADAAAKAEAEAAKPAPKPAPAPTTAKAGRRGRKAQTNQPTA